MAAPQVSAPVPELVWIRPPQQARSQQTLSRILDAAEAILAEKGWEDASVAEIARRAGSSVGAFYTRFPDKDTLLAALHCCARSRSRRCMTAASRDAPPRSRRRWRRASRA